MDFLQTILNDPTEVQKSKKFEVQITSNSLSSAKRKASLIFNKRKTMPIEQVKCNIPNFCESLFYLSIKLAPACPYDTGSRKPLTSSDSQMLYSEMLSKLRERKLSQII